MRKLSNVEKDEKTSLEGITMSCRCTDQKCTEAPVNRQYWTWIQNDCMLQGTDCPF